jgi:uncharacterized membrane protein YwaF
MKVLQLPEPSSAPSFGISAYLHIRSQKLRREFFATLFTANILAVMCSLVNYILEENPLLFVSTEWSKKAVDFVIFDRMRGWARMTSPLVMCTYTRRPAGTAVAIIMVCRRKR